ncbi:basic secretory family protein [Aspergillus candidus]|uniref:Peptidase of plants and bacteria-domain-containing protein n=1 Tax=Aspergillus candidus TaxID=41067 RepID=A0A2I2F731_ASPCN|nr:peptidase of plants and bacteria-domain-containing protein [Aspergillus candidus]PLB36450.1 peptidase of plants and bacteria-domain-containing protein [Aspergillus candidus]
MSTTTPSADPPRPSAAPPSSTQETPPDNNNKNNNTNTDINNNLDSSQKRRPQPDPPLPTPKLRLQVNDLRHPGTLSFQTLVPDVVSTLETALSTIIRTLYTVPPPQQDTSSPQSATHPTPITFTPSLPPTRSITLILRDIPGVAYTTATELDDSHKEITISLPYIHTSAKRPSEIPGVITHELVHCYQHTAPPAEPGKTNNKSTPHPPTGLIEGIADFVRLKAGLEPPHWKKPSAAKERAEKWDQGYQHTAYFLAWLEDVRVGRGAVGMLNDRLLRVGYCEEGGKEGGGEFWRGLFGVGVERLWVEYGEYLDGCGCGADSKTGEEGERDQEKVVVSAG